MLDAAVESLIQSNIHGLKYSQIAKSAGVTQALMGYHFPSLDELLFELVQMEIVKLKNISMESVERHMDNPAKALESYIRAPFVLAEKDPGFRAVWSCFYHLATIHPTFSDLNRSIRLMGRERILNLITMVLAKDKSLPKKMDQLGDLAVSVQGVITGYGFVASCETDGQFKKMADLAVRASFALLGVKESR